MTFIPSANQAAIADKMPGPRNILVQACAGSGKTTTMVWLAGQLPSTRRILALSFNKSIADELAVRMPPHVRSATMHSVGFGMIRRVVTGVRLDDKKLVNIIDTHPGVVAHQHGVRSKITADLLSIVPLAQDTMANTENSGVLATLAENSGKNLECPEKSLPLVASIIQAADKMRHYITYSEMIRHPVIHGYPDDLHDVVFVDEAQDLNSTQHALLRKLVRKNGKLVAVGDRFQSCYNFRGADPRSMDRLKADWDMEELPLDVSYRCSAAIIQEAQKIVGEETIKPHDAADTGEVLTARLEDLATVAQEGDMILCRINAPLVGIALRLLKAGKKAIIRGRDIGSQLASLVRRSKATTIKELLSYIADWKSDKISRAIAAKKSENALQSIEDTATTLSSISEECDTPEDVLGSLAWLFSDEKTGVMLSTVHKAKGLESETVYIVGPELLPAPWATSDADKEQERNIAYVAVTRARSKLVRVPLPERRKRRNGGFTDGA